MFNIIISEKPEQLAKQWCVYVLREVDTAEIKYVGYIRLINLFTLSDAKVNHEFDIEKPVMLCVIDICENSGMAYRQHAIRRREYRLPVKPHRLFGEIECITTNEVFPSAAEAARQHGIGQSNLSNHLNDRPGFKSVKGKIYRKVI